jgi:hypothetical protein
MSDVSNASYTMTQVITDSNCMVFREWAFPYPQLLERNGISWTHLGRKKSMILGNKRF